MEDKANERTEVKDNSYVSWSDLEHVKDIEVNDVESLNRKLRELYEMDFVVKVEQQRYKQDFYVTPIFGGVNRYLIKIYKRK